jgi:hypothetical protein
MADVVCAKTNWLTKLHSSTTVNCTLKLEVWNEITVKLDQSLNLMLTN